jgi:hypothetical protein
MNKLETSGVAECQKVTSRRQSTAEIIHRPKGERTGKLVLQISWFMAEEVICTYNSIFLNHGVF